MSEIIHTNEGVFDLSKREDQILFVHGFLIEKGASGRVLSVFERANEAGWYVKMKEEREVSLKEILRLKDYRDAYLVLREACEAIDGGDDNGDCEIAVKAIKEADELLNKVKDI